MRSDALYIALCLPIGARRYPEALVSVRRGDQRLAHTGRPNTTRRSRLQLPVVYRRGHDSIVGVQHGFKPDQRNNPPCHMLNLSSLIYRKGTPGATLDRGRLCGGQYCGYARRSRLSQQGFYAIDQLAAV